MNEQLLHNWKASNDAAICVRKRNSGTSFTSAHESNAKKFPIYMQWLTIVLSSTNGRTEGEFHIAWMILVECIIRYLIVERQRWLRKKIDWPWIDKKIDRNRLRPFPQMRFLERGSCVEVSIAVAKFFPPSLSARNGVIPCSYMLIHLLRSRQLIQYILGFSTK